MKVCPAPWHSQVEKRQGTGDGGTHEARSPHAGLAGVVTSFCLIALAGADDRHDWRDWRRWRFDRVVRQHANRQIEEGRRIFRYDTFGDEAFWGGTLRLHEAIEGAQFGGVGPGVSPRTALAVGLKVDVDGAADALGSRTCAAGRVDLDDPATTLALLRLNAVVGVTGFFDDRLGRPALGRHPVRALPFHGGRLAGARHRPPPRRLGQPRPERRRDRRTSRPTCRRSPTCWASTSRRCAPCCRAGGPGKFDAELFLDGKAFRPDGATGATLLPPAFGLVGSEPAHLDRLGLGDVLERVRGQPRDARPGNVLRPAPRRRRRSSRWPRARGFGNVRATPDLITPKLAGAPSLPARAARSDAARGHRSTPRRPRAGERSSPARRDCARCHVPPLFTEPGWNLHTPEEIGIDDFQADRSPDRRYRTTPLAGLWTPHQGRLLPRRPLRHAARPSSITTTRFFALGLSPAREARPRPSS